MHLATSFANGGMIINKDFTRVDALYALMNRVYEYTDKPGSVAGYKKQGGDRLEQEVNDWYSKVMQPQSNGVKCISYNLWEDIKLLSLKDLSAADIMRT